MLNHFVFLDLILTMLTKSFLLDQSKISIYNVYKDHEIDQDKKQRQSVH